MRWIEKTHTCQNFDQLSGPKKERATEKREGTRKRREARLLLPQPMATSLGLTFTQALDLGSAQNSCISQMTGKERARKMTPTALVTKWEITLDRINSVSKLPKSPHKQLLMKGRGSFVKDNNITNMLQHSAQFTDILRSWTLVKQT